MVSGLTGEGLAACSIVIDEVVPFDALETVRFRIPLRDGAAIALLHERGRVRAEDYDGNLCEMEVDAPESLRRRLQPLPGREFHASLWKILCTSDFRQSAKHCSIRRCTVFEPKRSNPPKRLNKKGLARQRRE